jgi:hypothetical protein
MIACFVAAFLGFLAGFFLFAALAIASEGEDEGTD